MGDEESRWQWLRIDDSGLPGFPLLAATIGNIGYGITLILFAIFSYLVLSKLERRHARTSDSALLGFVIVICICAILALEYDIATFWLYVRNIKDANPKSMFRISVIDPELPLWPLWRAFYYRNRWVVDSLLTWRSVLILENCRYSYSLLAPFPLLFLLGSIGLGIHQLLTDSFPRAIVIAQLCSTIGLKITLTTIICGTQYLYIQSKGFKLSPRYLSPSTAIISTLLECAAMAISLDLFVFIHFIPTIQLGKSLLQLLIYFQAIAVYFTGSRAVYVVFVPLFMSFFFPQNSTSSDSETNLKLNDSIG
ncbi:hypothetical protein BDQ17DRAFT_1350541 [Cyathus striatus]|nr:hypothetical protein BDQ17DRAFT_1350541 [Cyathus striatus]